MFRIYLIYKYEKDLALNNLQCLICPKTKPNQTWNYYFLQIIIINNLKLCNYLKYL